MLVQSIKRNFPLSPKILQKEVKDIDISAKDKVEELMVRHGLSDIPLTDLNEEKDVNDLVVAEVIITHTLVLDRRWQDSTVSRHSGKTKPITYWTHPFCQQC